MSQPSSTLYSTPIPPPTLPPANVINEADTSGLIQSDAKFKRAINPQVVPTLVDSPEETTDAETTDAETTEAETTEAETTEAETTEAETTEA